MLSGRLSIVAAAILWSTGGVAIKLSTLNASQIAAGRAAFAAVALFVFLPQARRRWSRGVLLTAIPLALTSILFISANQLTTAGAAIFIQNVAPIWILVATPWLLGERASRGELLSVWVSVFGCALFFADDLGAAQTTGNALAALASLTYAALIVRYRKVSSEDGVTATVCGNTLIALLCLPFVARGEVPTDIADLGVVMYLGLIQQALAAILFIRGVRTVSALEASLLLLLEPLLSPVWAFVLAGERMGSLAIAGGVVVFVAMLLRTFAARPRR